jgi:hypothetical protein
MGGAEATVGEVAVGDGAVDVAGVAADVVGAVGGGGMVVAVGGDGRIAGVERVAVAGATRPMREVAVALDCRPRY